MVAKKLTPTGNLGIPTNNGINQNTNQTQAQFIAEWYKTHPVATPDQHNGITWADAAKLGEQAFEAWLKNRK